MRKNFLLTLLILISINTPVFAAESPYKLDRKKDVILGGVGLGVNCIGLYYNNNITPLTIDEIENLSKSDVNCFDRPATSYWSKDLHKISDVLFATYGILPAALFLSKDIRKDVCTISTLFLETSLFTFGVNSLSKGVFQRIRPYVYNSNPDISMDIKTKKDAKRSFYSGHTTCAFASAVFTATIFSDYFPDSKWKTAVWSTTLLGASSMAFLRVRGGKHFPTDVLVGAAIGSFTGYLIPYLHRKNNDSKLTILPAYNRIQLQLSFN